MTMKKMLSVLLVFTMSLSYFGVQTIGASETESKAGKKDYIVVAKDNNAFKSQSKKMQIKSIGKNQMAGCRKVILSFLK